MDIEKGEGAIPHGRIMTVLGDELASQILRLKPNEFLRIVNSEWSADEAQKTRGRIYSYARNAFGTGNVETSVVRESSSYAVYIMRK